MPTIWRICSKAFRRSRNRRAAEVDSALLANLEVGQHFQRADHPRVIPGLPAMRGAGVEQLLTRRRIGQAHAHLPGGAQRKAEVLLMELDAKAGVERALDHPLAVHFENARRGEPT